MSCPTCDHTMASIGYCDGGTVHHCERCGTIKHSGPFIDPPLIYVPKLVERCRALEIEYVRRDEYPPLTRDWRISGIAESINVPAQRQGATT